MPCRLVVSDNDTGTYTHMLIPTLWTKTSSRNQARSYWVQAGQHTLHLKMGGVS